MTTLTDINASRLTEQLWTGGDLPDDTGQAVSRLGRWQAAGVRHVIDCRLEWSDAELVERFAPLVRYSHVGMDDAGQRVPDAWFDEVSGAARSTLRCGGGVLVHCHMGVNRGPSGAFAVLLSLGWDPIAAIDLIRTRRPCAAVAYAEDALGWWHRTSRAPARERRGDVERLRRWRSNNPHDTVRIIRSIREQEGS